MDIAVSPRAAGSVSVSDAVVVAQRVIEATGLTHLLHPMGTCIEGEPAELYQLAADIHSALAGAGYQRILVTIKLDERRDKVQHMSDKLKSVADKLSRGK